VGLAMAAARVSGVAGSAGNAGGGDGAHCVLSAVV